MKLLAILWLIGIAIAFGAVIAPSLGVALLLGSELYFIAVVGACVNYAKALCEYVRWEEQQLSTVRHGTITAKNLPLI